MSLAMAIGNDLSTTGRLHKLIISFQNQAKRQNLKSYFDLKYKDFDAG